MRGMPASPGLVGSGGGTLVLLWIDPVLARQVKLCPVLRALTGRSRSQRGS